MKEADVKDSKKLEYTRIRVYKAPYSRKYLGQTESLLQYLKAKNSSMDLDYMRQCCSDSNQVISKQSSTAARARKDLKLSKSKEEKELGKASSSDSTSYVSIDAASTKNEVNISIVKYGPNARSFITPINAKRYTPVSSETISLSMSMPSKEY